jgi:hypothetical protein
MDELRHAQGMIGVFSMFGEASREMMEELSSKEPKDKVESFKNARALLFAEIEDMRTKVDDAIKRAIQEKTSEDIDEAHEELSIFDYFKSFSQMSHPLLRFLREIVQKALAKNKEQGEDLLKKVQKEREKMTKWSEKTGKSVQDGYDTMIGESGTTLVAMYDQSYYEDRDNAIKDGDISWLRSNLDFDREAFKKYYDKAKEKKLRNLNILHPGKTGYIDSRMREWELNMNLLKNNEAWLNKRVAAYWLKPKESKKESFYSKGYKELIKPENKELLEVYNYLRDSNLTWQYESGMDIKMGFIPAIHKGTIDSFAQAHGHMGNKLVTASKTWFRDLVDGMQDHQDDSGYTYRDPSDKEVPFYFTRKIEDGEISRDLLSSNLIFGNMVNNWKNMRDIEALAQSARDILSNSDTRAIATDSKGKVVIDKVTKAFKKKLEKDNLALDLFDKFMNYYVYGEKIQNKDRVFELFGKNWSSNKVLLKLMSFMSVKSLAFNMRSATAGFLAASANAWFGGAKGQFYTQKHMEEVLTNLSNRDEKDKFWRLAEYFKVEKSNWIYEEADKLKASWISRNMTYDKWYLLQAKPDEFISNTILGAMSKHYGVDKNGMPKKLSLLPEGSKSIWDLTSFENDKINIKGMSPEGITQFRAKAMYVSKSMKGTNTAEDISAIQTFVLGRSIMHFRNWMAPMFQERFRGLEYNKEIEEWEMGRYRVFIGELAGKRIPDTMRNIAKLALDMGLGWSFRGKRIRAIKTHNSERHFNKFLASNPNHRLVQRMNLPKSDPNYLSYEDAFSEFDMIREGQLRAMMAELRVYVLVVAAITALGMDMDDDEKMYHNIPGGKAYLSYLERLEAELTFFLNPTSTKELLRSPIPVMQVMVDIVNMSDNTVDEILDYIFGTEVQSGRNAGKRERERSDKTGWGYYSGRMIPMARPVLEHMEMLASTQD